MLDPYSESSGTFFSTMNINKEVWRKALGFNGVYEVSNYGNIMSYNIPKNKKPRLLKPYMSKQGYLRITLRRNAEIVHKQVATLVAEAFLPNPDNLPQINHKDENKTNNFVWVNDDGTVDPERSNLEWCSCKDNINHGTRNKRMVETRSRLGQSRGEMAVVQLSLDGRLINVFRSMCEAERQIGAYPSIICKCCKGRMKKHHGYKWRYLSDYILEQGATKENVLSRAEVLLKDNPDIGYLRKNDLLKWIKNLEA